jgi:hypothetical protein
MTGLSVNAISIDDGAPPSSTYQIMGNAITLGPGGLTASTNSSSLGLAALRMPIALAASQTWSIDGNSNGSQLGLYGNVTGSSPLAISLSHRTFLGLNGNDVEVGPVTITGGDATASGNSSFRNGSVAVGSPSADGQLNGTDGNSVSLTHAGMTTENATVGPLTSTGGNLQVGQGGPSAKGTLTVNGALTLDSATALDMFVNSSGGTAGTDYSQINASGTVDLGGAHFLPSGDAPSGGCPALNQGDVYTLITSGAGVTGTLAGIPDGTTVTLGCSPSPQPALRINYTSRTVTATVVPSVASPPPPVEGKTATVAPEKGKVLIKLPHGSHPKAFGLSAAASSGFVPLTAGATVPVGATLDTTHGQVRLITAANHSGSSMQTGHFSKGVFTILQARKNPLTTVSMTGGGLSGCSTKLPHGGAAKRATAARKRKRSLFSNVRGHFRSRGRNSEATVRGTKWSMTDTCAGTLTSVTRGSVVVHDFRLRKNVTVKAGHKYFARAVKH